MPIIGYNTPGCGKQFLRKDDITRHTMYHHNPKTVRITFYVNLEKRHHRIIVINIKERITFVVPLIWCSHKKQAHQCRPSVPLNSPFLYFIQTYIFLHEQEDRFRCLFCGAAFHRADKLRVHSRKCNEVLVDDYGDIAESSEEESEETGSTNFQSDEVGASSILLPNRCLSETVPSSDDQAAVDESIPTPSGSSQVSSADIQGSDRGFLKSSEASLLQMCLEKSRETSLPSKTAPS